MLPQDSNPKPQFVLDMLNRTEFRTARGPIHGSYGFEANGGLSGQSDLVRCHVRASMHEGYDMWSQNVQRLGFHSQHKIRLTMQGNHSLNHYQATTIRFPLMKTETANLDSSLKRTFVQSARVNWCLAQPGRIARCLLVRAMITFERLLRKPRSRKRLRTVVSLIGRWWSPTVTLATSLAVSRRFHRCTRTIFRFCHVVFTFALGSSTLPVAWYFWWSIEIVLGSLLINRLDTWYIH